ncbi:hypothetical protein T484DRAFT_1795686 [Baffinella frigidus]|nr:hypothetical protein T484DRAFT_1795686 [Cryptophyta sp. CCMP2293]
MGSPMVHVGAAAAGNTARSRAPCAFVVAGASTSPSGLREAAGRSMARSIVANAVPHSNGSSQDSGINLANPPTASRAPNVAGLQPPCDKNGCYRQVSYYQDTYGSLIAAQSKTTQSAPPAQRPPTAKSRELDRAAEGAASSRPQRKAPENA